MIKIKLITYPLLAKTKYPTNTNIFLPHENATCSLFKTQFINILQIQFCQYLSNVFQRFQLQNITLFIALSLAPMLSQNDSLLQICDELERLSSDLKEGSTLTLIGSILEASQCKTIDSWNINYGFGNQELSNTYVGSAEFLNYIFESDHHDFQNFLFEQMKKQSSLKSRAICKKKEHLKKTKFIEKHKSPKTVFNYHGIDIEVVYGKYESTFATCLVLLYEKLEGLQKIISNKSLWTAIMRKFNYGRAKDAEEKGEIFSLKNQNRLSHKNFKWLYLFKKPSFKHMPLYSQKKLQTFINLAIQKGCAFINTESIAFTNFDWPGLEKDKKCSIFFWAILDTLQKQMERKAISLKRITVCCEIQQSFFQFTNTLREISDSYMRSGSIPI